MAGVDSGLHTHPLQVYASLYTWNDAVCCSHDNWAVKVKHGSTIVVRPTATLIRQPF